MLDTEAIKEEGYRRELTRRMSAELDILISKARYAKSSILAAGSMWTGQASTLRGRRAPRI